MIHVESTDINIFTPLSKVWLSFSLFAKRVIAERHHVKIFCTEIHPHRSKTTEIHLRSEVKYDSVRAQCHEPSAAR